jgi:hypothetical protein
MTLLQAAVSLVAPSFRRRFTPRASHAETGDSSLLLRGAPVDVGSGTGPGSSSGDSIPMNFILLHY